VLLQRLRLAASIARKDGHEVRVFLMGDAASCAKAGQKVPAGYYNIQNMLAGVTKRGGAVGVCGTCMDARGIAPEELVEGAHRGTMDELTEWTATTDQVLIF
jgi:uncharacterized protein involved in oxidation of intracellular sulfur